MTSLAHKIGKRAMSLLDFVTSIKVENYATHMTRFIQGR